MSKTGKKGVQKMYKEFLHFWTILLQLKVKNKNKCLLGQAWLLQAEPWPGSPRLHRAGSRLETCRVNRRSCDSASLNPRPRDRDETRSPSRPDLLTTFVVEFTSSNLGTRSRLPYESINLWVSAEVFGGKFDSAQSRRRFRFPPPHEAEQLDHGSHPPQTANLPSNHKSHLSHAVSICFNLPSS